MIKVIIFGKNDVGKKQGGKGVEGERIGKRYLRGYYIGSVENICRLKENILTNLFTHVNRFT